MQEKTQTNMYRVSLKYSYCVLLCALEKCTSLGSVFVVCFSQDFVSLGEKTNLVVFECTEMPDIDYTVVQVSKFLC